MTPSELIHTLYKATYDERQRILSLLNAPRTLDPPDYSKPICSFNGSLEKDVRDMLSTHFSAPDDDIKKAYIQERRSYAKMLIKKFKEKPVESLNDELFQIEYAIFLREKKLD
jgi:hypothetical protein